MYELYTKLKDMVKFVEDELNKSLENYSLETRPWSEGYSKTMTTIIEYLNALNDTDER